MSYMHYIYMLICVFVFIPDYHVMFGIVFVFYVLSVSLINVRNGSRRVFVVDIICDCCSASSLKEQSADRYVTNLGHIINMFGQPVFVLTP
jgi:hypothetical protein